ncbi:Cell wall-associated hydrolase, NlpC family [Rhodococcus pyridinivorans]|uniref:NlpC/P60 family protein n=1 Tax=Rhodococcus pyridinivorans TaxID=103816 RepID=UPI000894A809|nr:NlpC/P60 family protein [Rhodococcus pyridinivorans]MBX4167574.1 C40 family peptidase [Rhodococcus sp. DMU2021]SED03472.1 Cell wall-associated hydrolase, NlpC family [Rhodococcus pyridinivorans]
MRRFGIHGGIPRRSGPDGTATTLTAGRRPDGPTPGRTPRTRTGTLLAGLGLVTAVLLTVTTTASAAPPPPPNPSDAEIDRAGAAVAANIDRVGQLIVRIAGADQQLAELDAHVAIRREDVNRALVDLQSARDAADLAERVVVDSRRALDDAADRIFAAQKNFDAFVRDSYTRGANSVSLAAFLDVDGPDDLLDRAQVMRLLSAGRAAVLDALQRARAQEANSHSRARAAKLEADAAAEAAEQRRAEAEAAIAVARAELGRQAAEKSRIEQERANAQSELDRARVNVAGLEGQRAQYQDWDRRRAAEEAAAAAAAEEARVAAAAAAERVAADAAARERAAELANGRRPHTLIEESPSTGESDVASPGEVTTESGAPEGSDTDTSGTDTSGTDTAAPDYTDDATVPDGTDGGSVPDGTDSGTIPDEDEDEDSGDDGGIDWENPDPGDPVVETPGSGTGGSGSRPSTPNSTPGTPSRPSVTGPAAVEIVIDRAMSQIGVPYAWGGGNENGPTRGIRDGGVADVHGDYAKVGFDCSGLMIYAFAGIGISLPHYTGYQYTAGTQVPSSQMRRGDMIFYGPNASQHVALYLGDGQMLEAPQSGSFVKISPVRWGGMTPYVVRMVS